MDNISSKFSINVPPKKSDSSDFIPLPKEFLDVKRNTKNQDGKRIKIHNPIDSTSNLPQKRIKTRTDVSLSCDPLASTLDSEDSIDSGSEAENTSENIIHSSILGTGSFCPSDKREFIKDMLFRCQVEPSSSCLFNCNENDTFSPEILLGYAQVVREFYATDSTEGDLISSLNETQQKYNFKNPEIMSVWEVSQNFLIGLYKNYSSSEGVIPQNFFAEYYLNSTTNCELPFEHALRQTSLSLLEKSYREFIEKVVAPEVTPDASLDERFTIFVPKISGIAKDNGEPFNRKYFWASLFYMFRGGYYTELQAYISSNISNVLSGDRELLKHLQAFIQNNNQKLSDEVVLVLARDARRLMDVFLGKPSRYQMALIKIIGGLEPKSINIPEVLLTTEDFLWSQVHMSRGNSTTCEAADSSYSSDYSLDSLNDSQNLPSQDSLNSEAKFDRVPWNWESLKKMIVTFGPESFLSSPTHPSGFFKLLLLTGQFEMAISYLAESPVNEIEALHLAIAFNYYGLLRLSKKAKLLLTREICNTAEKQGKLYSSIHFSNLFLSVSKKFNSQDHLEIIPYLCLMSTLPQKCYEEKSHLFFRKLVLETRNYSDFLGYLQPDGKLIPGLLDTHQEYLHINNFETFRKVLVCSAIAQEITDGSLETAERLFGLIKDYDSSVHILNKQLSDLLFPFSLCSPNNVTIGFKEHFSNQVDSIHRRLLFYYHIDRSHIKESTRHANATLMEMLDFLRNYFNSNDRARIDVLNLFLIPLSIEYNDVQFKANALSEFPSWIQRCFPHVLRHALDFIAKEVGDPYNTNQPEDRELVFKARALQSLSICTNSLHLPPKIADYITCPSNL